METTARGLMPPEQVEPVAVRAEEETMVAYAEIKKVVA